MSENKPEDSSIVVSGDRYTTPESYGVEVKGKAYDLFLNSSSDFSDIALSLGVPVRTVTAWAKSGGWIERKREIEAAIFAESEAKYKSFIIENRLPEAKRQLEAAQKLEDGVLRMVDKALEKDKVPNSLELRRITETLVGASGVSSRVLGIHDKMFDSISQNAVLQGKTPLVVLNVNASLPSGAEPKYIEAEYEGPGEQ